MSILPDHRRIVRVTKAQKSFKQAALQEKNHQQRNASKSNGKKFTPIKTSQTNPSVMKTKTLSTQIDRYLNGARNTKDKIFKGLQFVKLVDNFNQQQRCLKHNHVVTLYCLNDKRLLCVYCIYGQNSHRSHKLLPPLEHVEYLAQDLLGLQNNFNEFLYSLEDILAQSNKSTQIVKDIMKRYLTKLQAEFNKKKLNLQQMYEKQKDYIIETCESLISKSQDIYTQFEEIKFNIWQCQARYHLDKKVKLPNMPFQTKMEITKSNSKIANKNNEKQKSLSKSSSKVKNKNQIENSQPKILSNSEQKHQISVDSEKDLRQIMCKHIILHHIVQEMKHIEPLKLDKKEVQKKIFNKSQLKLTHNSALTELSPRSKSTTKNQTVNYFRKK